MAIVRVQANRAGFASNTGSAGIFVTATASGFFSAPTTPGNTLILIGYGTAANGEGVTAGLPTATATGRWTDAGNTGVWGSNPGGTQSTGLCGVYYYANAPAFATNSAIFWNANGQVASGQTVSVNAEFQLFEYSGISTGSPLDVVLTNKTGTGTPNAGTLTTSFIDLIVSAYVANGNETPANIGSGYTSDFAMTGTAIGIGQSQYKLNVAAGSIPTSWGSSVGGTWGAAAIAFSSGSTAVASALQFSNPPLLLGF